MTNQPLNLKEHIGLRIKFIRNSRRLTIASSAGALGITRKQFQNYEKGTSDIKISRLFEIAKLMNVDISFFFEGFDKNCYNLSDCDKDLLINFSKIKNNEIKSTLANLIGELS